MQVVSANRWRANESEGVMAKRIPVSELIRLACVHAEISLECADNAEDRELAAQIRTYRLNRWGKTYREAAMDGCHATGPKEIACRPNTAFSITSPTNPAASPSPPSNEGPSQKAQP